MHHQKREELFSLRIICCHFFSCASRCFLRWKPDVRQHVLLNFLGMCAASEHRYIAHVKSAGGAIVENRVQSFFRRMIGPGCHLQRACERATGRRVYMYVAFSGPNRC